MDIKIDNAAKARKSRERLFRVLERRFNRLNECHETKGIIRGDTLPPPKDTDEGLAILGKEIPTSTER